MIKHCSNVDLKKSSLCIFQITKLEIFFWEAIPDCKNAFNLTSRRRRKKRINPSSLDWSLWKRKGNNRLYVLTSFSSTVLISCYQGCQKYPQIMEISWSSKHSYIYKLCHHSLALFKGSRIFLKSIYYYFYYYYFNNNNNYYYQYYTCWFC